MRDAAQEINETNQLQKNAGDCQPKYDILRPKSVWGKSLSCLSWPFVLSHCSLLVHHFWFVWSPSPVCLCTDCLAWSLTDCLSFGFFVLSNSPCITASLSVFLSGQPMSWDLQIMFPQPLFGYSNIWTANSYRMKWRRLLTSGSRDRHHHHRIMMTRSWSSGNPDL